MKLGYFHTLIMFQFINKPTLRGQKNGGHFLVSQSGKIFGIHMNIKYQ